VTRIALFGGTFDPVHVGHLAIAEAARRAIDGEVIFVPTGRNPLKPEQPAVSAEHRVELVRLALDGASGMRVDRDEIERREPSYTVETLRALREARPDDELFLLLGADQAERLPTWHEPEAVIELATVCAVERVGYSRNAIVIKLARLKGAQRLRFLDMPMIQVSSSSLRRRVAKGKPIRYLVPDEVARYIEDKGLYGAPTAVGTG
jgi:nicotinate-nucleotide adenylyltransferase